MPEHHPSAVFASEPAFMAVIIAKLAVPNKPTAMRRFIAMAEKDHCHEKGHYAVMEKLRVRG